MPYIRTIFVASAAFVATCVMSTAAYAGYAASTWQYAAANSGITYDMRSWVLTGSGATGGAEIRTANGGNAPTGYMGAQASLWRSGSLCKQTGWAYNSTPRSLMTAGTTPLDCGPGNYYGDGQVQSYKQSNGTYEISYPPGSPYVYQN